MRLSSASRFDLKENEEIAYNESTAEEMHIN